MDRNGGLLSVVRFATVALRKESVDRNSLYAQNRNFTKHVALRKESVDRNVQIITSGYARERSLSARRAWIEIAYGALDGASEIVALRKESVDRNPASGWRLTGYLMVALRKESVDRNRLVAGFLHILGGSLSARRAWIEIR